MTVSSTNQGKEVESEPDSTSQISPKVIFQSVGATRATGTLDWASPTGDILAFAANCHVAVVDLYSKTTKNGIQLQVSKDLPVITSLLRGHTSRVNALALDHSHGLIISGGADKTLRIWQPMAEGTATYTQQSCFSHHTSGIHCLGVMKGISQEILGNMDSFIASAAPDGTVNIYRFTSDDEGYKLFQTLKVGNKYPLSMAFTVLPCAPGEVPGTPLLVMAGTDSLLHLYLLQQHDDELSFSRVLTLKGHVDWIRSLDIVQSQTNGSLMIATASQDRYIRLWELDSISAQVEQDSLSTKSFLFYDPHGRSYTVQLYAVLAGHEDAVASVKWNGPGQLISSSADSTVICWERDSTSSLWVPVAHVGNCTDMVGGFLNAIALPDGRIVATGPTGSVSIWKCKDMTTSESSSAEKTTNYRRYDISATVSGHFGSVEDLSWGRAGLENGKPFLVTTSADQTTRVFSSFLDSNAPQSTASWHEIARPQVHGYDISTISIVKKHQSSSSSTSVLLASGADEKVIRIFEAPQTFDEQLCALESAEGRISLASSRNGIAVGAMVPALGLSNKAVYSKAAVIAKDSAFDAIAQTSDDLSHENHKKEASTVLPDESALSQTTLWPEIQKLYAHPYEIITLASSPNGEFLASACKSSTATHADIKLWDTQTWDCIGGLKGIHTLSITDISFSPDGRWLLSTSRDRTWALYERSQQTDPVVQGAKPTLPFRAVKHVKSHARITWAGVFTPDSQYFATASRDKTVKLWSTDSASGYPAVGTVSFRASVNSIDIIQISGASNNENEELKAYLMAVGCEDGSLHMVRLSSGGETRGMMGVIHRGTMDPSLWHMGVVKAVQFQSCAEAVMLATCGQDHLVRVLEISEDLLK